MATFGWCLTGDCKSCTVSMQGWSWDARNRGTRAGSTIKCDCKCHSRKRTIKNVELPKEFDD